VPRSFLVITSPPHRLPREAAGVTGGQVVMPAPIGISQLNVPIEVTDLMGGGRCRNRGGRCAAELCTELVRPGGHAANIDARTGDASPRITAGRDVTVKTGLVGTYLTLSSMYRSFHSPHRCCTGAFWLVTLGFHLQPVDRGLWWRSWDSNTRPLHWQRIGRPRLTESF